MKKIILETLAKWFEDQSWTEIWRDGTSTTLIIDGSAYPLDELAEEIEKGLKNSPEGS